MISIKIIIFAKVNKMTKSRLFTKTIIIKTLT